MAQHILSHGRTTFHLRLYISLITLVLTLLGIGISIYVHLPIRFRALVWLPSYGVLGFITDFHLETNSDTFFFSEVFWFIAYLFIVCCALFLLRHIHERRNDTSPVTSFLWPNLLIVFLGMAFTLLMGNTNRTLHYELRMEGYIARGEYSRLLEICADDQHPSRCVMAARAYALSRQNELGERLFTFNDDLGSDALFPAPSDSIRPANLPKILRDYLGGFPIHDMHATHFFTYLAVDTLAKPPVRDYLLCSLLLDKNLNDFANYLVRYYSSSDTVSNKIETNTVSNIKKNSKKKTLEPIHLSSLPRHYAEALLLYDRTTEHPIAVLDDAEILQNYLDFTDQMKTVHTDTERQALCREYYGNTYWCYYYFSHFHPLKVAF